MPSRDPELQQVVVRMPSELHLALKARAAQDDRSMAQLVRFLVRRYIEDAP